MSVKRQPQIPLSRAPREDVVGAVAAGAAREEPAPAAAQPMGEARLDRNPQHLARRPKKRLVTFTNRLDPDLLDWLSTYKDEQGTTIAAVLDEAVRDYIEKVTGARPKP